MWCPTHKNYISAFDEECPKCAELGIVTIEEKFDKQSRTFDTLTCQGYTFIPRKSYAVMVFEKPKEEK